MPGLAASGARNVTRVPGVPPVTVAVSVTGWPAVLGFGLAVTSVVVWAVATVTVTVPLLAVVVPVAATLAVTVSVPVGRAVVARVATPLAFVVAVPSGAVWPFTVNVTVVPVGTPVTVAVSVTGWPAVAVVGLATNVVVVAVSVVRVTSFPVPPTYEMRAGTPSTITVAPSGRLANVPPTGPCRHC